MSSLADMAGYLRGWAAALDEMRRPDWREVHDRTSRDIAAGRGRDLDRPPPPPEEALTAELASKRGWPFDAPRSMGRNCPLGDP